MATCHNDHNQSRDDKTMVILNTFSTCRVKLELGTIQGGIEDGVFKFYGIPYGENTGGHNRWKPPIPKKPWQDILYADRFGDICPQISYMPDIETKRDLQQSEDCLNLNIWTPDLTPGRHYPVMVWIHGGGFLNGAGSFRVYDGTELAKAGAVVVTFNYRLGPFGFLAHPSLQEESELNISGNYGVMDQILALKWVHNHIERFGGDPDNITVFGQSAGAGSVNTLMQCPEARPLIQRVILQSGGFPSKSDVELVKKEKALQYGEEFMQKMGLSDLEELRAAPVDQILKQGKEIAYFTPKETLFTWAPIKGQYPLEAGDLFQNYEGKTLMMGTTKNEWSFFSGFFPMEENRAGLEKRVQQLFGERAQQILDLLQVDDDGKAKEALNRINSLNMLTKDLYESMLKLVHSVRELYVYQFDRVSKYTADLGIGASHGEELPYIFGTLSAFSENGYLQEDKLLSQTMIRYWVQFAKGDQPGEDETVRWPQFTINKQEYLRLDHPIRVTSFLEEDPYHTILHELLK